MNDRIKTPRGVIIKAGKTSCRLVWKPGFAPNANARYDSAQKYVDSEVLRLSDPYVPMQTGMLRKSGILGTVVGSGTVQYVAPYAKRQYYRKWIIGSRTGPLRGPLWFERMKADHGKQIIAGAKKIGGGKA